MGEIAIKASEKSTSEPIAWRATDLATRAQREARPALRQSNPMRAGEHCFAWGRQAGFVTSTPFVQLVFNVLLVVLP